MKNAVFWDVARCTLYRHFGGRIASIFRVEKSASEEPEHDKYALGHHIDQEVRR
jgi:hypothetical protein